MNSILSISYEDAINWNWQIVGGTGTGKGLLLQLIVSQFIMNRSSCVFFDPKFDDFLPKILSQECERHDVPFFMIDLEFDNAHLTLFKNDRFEIIEQCLSAGFMLDFQGNAQDFYKSAEQEIVEELSFFIKEHSKLTVPEAINLFLRKDICNDKNVKKLTIELKRLCQVKSINTLRGIDIQEAIESHSLIYIKCSTDSSRILLLQRILLASILQYCKYRERDCSRHVAIVLDEFKYLLSNIAVKALATIRSMNANIIVAHQSIDDLKDCPANMDNQSVVSAITENCNIKITYKVKAPETARYFAEMSGEILVEEPQYIYETTNSLTQQKKLTKTTREVASYYMEPNVFKALKKGEAVMFFNGLPQKFYTSPITLKSTTIEPCVDEKYCSEVKVDKFGCKGLIDVD
jgi:hypothetical protein